MIREVFVDIYISLIRHALAENRCVLFLGLVFDEIEVSRRLKNNHLFFNVLGTLIIIILNV